VGTGSSFAKTKRRSRPPSRFTTGGGRMFALAFIVKGRRPFLGNVVVDGKNNVRRGIALLWKGGGTESHLTILHERLGRVHGRKESCPAFHKKTLLTALHPGIRKDWRWRRDI